MLSIVPPRGPVQLIQLNPLFLVLESATLSIQRAPCFQQCFNENLLRNESSKLVPLKPYYHMVPIGHYIHATYKQFGDAQASCFNLDLEDHVKY